MAVRDMLQLVFQTNAQLQQFLIPNAQPTGVVLGGGAYGVVEELDINGAICAGKKIHECLIDPGNVAEGVENISRKYLQECQLMSDLRHPNVVQFLGVCFLPNATLPVLVMERLTSSLHDLLVSNPNIPLSVKSSILADIARGLVYLHNCRPPVIHRDLSAKNVLLNAAMKAKIGDLGNARIANFQQAYTLSRVPGTIIYMPPQAFHGIPSYGPELDVFSFGHLAIFTAIQIFPTDLLSPNYPDPENIDRLLGRTEVQRRETYFGILYQQLGERHPLVQLIIQCLQNIPSQRPSAEELLQQLEDIKAQINDPDEQLTKLDAMRMLREKDNEIQDLQQQISGQERELASIHAALTDNESQLTLKDAEILRLQQQLSGQERELASVHAALANNESQLTLKNAEILRLQQQTSVQDKRIMSLEADLEARVIQIRQLGAEIQQSEDETHELISKLKNQLQECQERKEEALISIQEQSDEHKQEMMSIKATFHAQVNALAKERDSLRKQAQRKVYNPASKLNKTTGGDYKGVFEDFQEFTTVPEQLLEVLEDNLGDVEGRKVQCEIFQTTYDIAKSRVKVCISHTLECLYSPGQKTSISKEAMEDVSRAYAILLHAAGLFKETRRKAITDYVCEVVYSIYKAQPTLADFLKKDDMQQAAIIAMKFITLPNPVIVCQPVDFNSKIHDKEHGYFDDTAEAELVYTRPVIYRCHEGTVVFKGIVANCKIQKLMVPKQKKQSKASASQRRSGTALTREGSSQSELSADPTSPNTQQQGVGLLGTIKNSLGLS